MSLYTGDLRQKWTCSWLFTRCVGRRFAAALLPRLFGTNPRSHHKGATGRVRTGDQQLPVLCHCQLGQDIPTQARCQISNTQPELLHLIIKQCQATYLNCGIITVILPNRIHMQGLWFRRSFSIVLSCGTLLSITAATICLQWQLFTIDIICLYTDIIYNKSLIP